VLTHAKNILLAHAIITRQHSGGGTVLAGAYVTPADTVLVGDIRHPPTAFVLAGVLCRPPALCLCKINNPFLKYKTLSNKKVVKYKVL
jgi:hypothetical protein